MDRISAGTAVSTITTSSASDDYLVRAKFLPAFLEGLPGDFYPAFVEGETPLWEAGAVLAERIDLNSAGDREIFTYMDLESPKKQDFEAINSTLVDALNTEWSERRQRNSGYDRFHQG